MAKRAAMKEWSTLLNNPAPIAANPNVTSTASMITRKLAIWFSARCSEYLAKNAALAHCDEKPTTIKAQDATSKYWP